MLLFFSQICICRHFIIFLFSRSKAIQFGVRVFLYALNILANVSLFLFTNQPTFDLNIIKFNALAGVSLVASHHNWKKQAILNVYVL